MTVNKGGRQHMTQHVVHSLSYRWHCRLVTRLRRRPQSILLRKRYSSNCSTKKSRKTQGFLWCLNLTDPYVKANPGVPFVLQIDYPESHDQCRNTCSFCYPKNLRQSEKRFLMLSQSMLAYLICINVRCSSYWSVYWAASTLPALLHTIVPKSPANKPPILLHSKSYSDLILYLQQYTTLPPCIDLYPLPAISTV